MRDDYIYRDFRGLDWQAVHDDYKAQIAAAADDQAVYSLVAKMISDLNDGHSAFLDPEEVAQDDALRNGDLTISGIGVLSQEISSTVRSCSSYRVDPRTRLGFAPSTPYGR